MGIRELKAQKREALKIYHEECERIDTAIEAIRNKRGTKLKEHYLNAEDAHLMNIADGRSLPRPNGNW